MAKVVLEMMESIDSPFVATDSAVCRTSTNVADYFSIIKPPRVPTSEALLKLTTHTLPVSTTSPTYHQFDIPPTWSQFLTGITLRIDFETPLPFPIENCAIRFIDRIELWSGPLLLETHTSESIEKVTRLMLSEDEYVKFRGMVDGTSTATETQDYYSPVTFTFPSPYENQNAYARTGRRRPVIKFVQLPLYMWFCRRNVDERGLLGVSVPTLALDQRTHALTLKVHHASQPIQQILLGVRIARANATAAELIPLNRSYVQILVASERFISGSDFWLKTPVTWPENIEVDADADELDMFQSVGLSATVLNECINQSLGGPHSMGFMYGSEAIGEYRSYFFLRRFDENPQVFDTSLDDQTLTMDNGTTYVLHVQKRIAYIDHDYNDDYFGSLQWTPADFRFALFANLPPGTLVDRITGPKAIFELEAEPDDYRNVSKMTMITVELPESYRLSALASYAIVDENTASTVLKKASRNQYMTTVETVYENMIRELNVLSFQLDFPHDLKYLTWSLNDDDLYENGSPHNAIGLGQLDPLSWGVFVIDLCENRQFKDAAKWRLELNSTSPRWPDSRQSYAQSLLQSYRYFQTSSYKPLQFMYSLCPSPMQSTPTGTVRLDRHLNNRLTYIPSPSFNISETKINIVGVGYETIGIYNGMLVRLNDR